MPHYAINVTKDQEWDRNLSKRFNSKEDLDATFNAYKDKYHAIEDPKKESTRGYMGVHGLFKNATGECKHGKRVEIQYLEYTNETCEF